jgi:hypothetical protein
MLRITTQTGSDSLTFQLEGKLAGPWVRELEECWQGTRVGGGVQSVRFDLRGLTFIDAAGKAFLAARYAEGAEFVAAGCLMKSIVAEIAPAPMLVRRVTEEGK